jgi:uncharacterized protein (TIGR03083 family)
MTAPDDDALIAYVLDALDADETARVERAIVGDAALAEHVSDLREALTRLVDEPSSPIAPGPGARSSMLTRALQLRAPGRHLANTGDAALPAHEVHRRTAADLDELVASLTDADLSTATAYGVTTGALLAHVVGRLEHALARLESHDASNATVASAEASGEPYDHWRATTAHVDALAHDLGALRVALRGVNERVVHALVAHRSLGDPHDLGSLDARTTAVSFETWMHADDVRLALGRAVSTPDVERLERLCTLVADTLPLAMTTRGVAHTGRSIRLVLTGPGGGVWVTPAAHGEGPVTTSEPDSTLVVDGVTFCRLFHEQVSLVGLELMIEGDAALVDDALAATGAFAERL